MSEEFDPYYAWLGIPPEEQPADHYRLLGVRQFEPNSDVISNAADQRIVYLRTFQVGKRSALSQQLLNELTQAKLCLLAPDSRRNYDLQLRAKLAPQPILQSPPAQPVVIVRPTPLVQSPLETLPAWNPEQQMLGAHRDTSPIEKLQQWVKSANLSSSTIVISLSLLGLTISILGAAVLWGTLRGSGSPPQNATLVAQAIPAVTPASEAAPPPVAPVVPVPAAAPSPPAPAKASEPMVPTPPVANPAPPPMPAPSPMPVVTTPPQREPEKVAEKKPVITVTPAPSTKEPPAVQTEEPLLDLVDSATAVAELTKLGAQFGRGPSGVDVVYFVGPNASDDAAKYVASIPSLHAVTLRGSKVTGQSLRYITKLSSLKDLNLSGCTISDEDLPQLARLTNLVGLNLTETSITGDGVRHLTSLNGLESLSLPNSVTSEVFLHLSKIQNLKHVNPLPTIRNDDDLKLVCEVKGLRILSLHGSNSSSITVEGYKHLENLTEIEFFNFPPSPPPGAIFYLRKAKLRTLSFPENASEKEIEPFVEMKSIRQLVPPRDISDVGLKMVAKMTNLEELYLGHASRVTNAGLAELSAMPSLMQIAVHRQIDDQGIAHLAKIKSLRNVSVFFSETVTPEGWSHLAELPLLESVVLPPNFSDEGIKALKACPNIKYLDFRGAAISAEGLSDLKVFKKLEHLSLNEKKFTPKEVDALKSLKTLKTLSFQKCTLNPEDLDALKSALPQCQIHYYP
ncbi:MAG: hypothetical protein ACO1RA_02155 [Planctomycetaceae bacterium]